MSRAQNVKIVAVGDGAVGKTCLLIVYSKKEFPTEYVPTVFENYTCHVPVNDKRVAISLWDTAGQEEYEKLRPLSYPNTDVFLVCFSVDNHLSLENVDTKWVAELKHHVSNPQILLVGTKADVSPRQVTTAEGEEMKKKIGAFAYMECSAKQSRDSVTKIFETAIKFVLFPAKPKKGACTIL
ncbi:putative Rho-related protein racB [Paratrimastix pyriformis]|uniref:Rho-related protein racB n=1 Tax=Paratrimastix pyriformis TaxID=342808 RepID=A0ABQ8UFD9_9EUKA|nr:putative Rho-related protein racB [Paratrimastix pyriformis]